MSQWIMFSLAAFDLQISTEPNFSSQRAAYETEASSWHCKLFLTLTSQGFYLRWHNQSAQSLLKFSRHYFHIPTMCLVCRIG